MSITDMMRKVARPATIVGGYRSATAAFKAPTTVASSSVPGAPVPPPGVNMEVRGSAQPEVVGGIDAWEFAGGREEEFFDALHPAPRMVFGAVPSIDEAKEATRDLKDTIETVYFSSPATEAYGMGSIVDTMGSETSGMRVITIKENPVVNSTRPNQVAQVFSLLQECPEVQNVVASIASDENVWNAVMKNQKVMEFYENLQTTCPPKPKESVESVGLDDDETRESSKRSETLGNFSSVPEFGCIDFMQVIRLKVSEMVSNLSDFFQEIVGASTGGRGGMITNTSMSDASKMIYGSSFIALAIAAILVVLVKRG